MSFDFEELKEILVCPKSKSKLVLHEESLVCVDPDCRLKYDIRDGIPIMLVDEANETPTDEWSAIMQQYGRDPQTGEELNSESSSSAPSAAEGSDSAAQS